MLKLTDRWQTENIHWSVQPKYEAVEDFVEHRDKFMKGTIWDQECSSWYKNNSASGKVTALCRKFPSAYKSLLRRVVTRYNSVRKFPTFGQEVPSTILKPFLNPNSTTGISNILTTVSPTWAMESTSDWAYYIRNEDDSPFLGRAKWLRVVNRTGEAEKIETFQVKVTFDWTILFQ